MLTMFDSIDVHAIPAGAQCVAGYTDGRWPTYVSLVRMFPHARVLPIAVFASEDAEALDVENGDATPAQVPGWVKRQIARGVHRPVIYCSAAVVNAVLDALKAAGITRGEVRLWSAHYGAGRHICGPGTCGYIDASGRVVPACDGTQWTDQSGGRNLDESILLDDFFDGPPKPVEADVPGTWKAIISVTPIANGWCAVGVGEDGNLWTVSSSGVKPDGRPDWGPVRELDTVTIRP